MNLKNKCCRVFFFAWIAGAGGAPVMAAVRSLDIEPVWSGHPVGFALLVDGPDCFIAYYNADRVMTVAHRRRDQSHWTFKRLPTQIGWDSHNYIVMALDREGFLHVSGNMHAVPLIYFRSENPRDIESLQPIQQMVAPKIEQRVTYPLFMNGPDDALIFRYRDGGSGNGNDHYNVYDEKTRTWKALLEHPLLDGRGEVNGYFSLPRQGPDGFYHMIGVWRDTPDAATNHDLSYARSRDLRQWERGDGRPLSLPMTVQQIDIVDPVPAQGGMINGGLHLGFDSKNRPVITYHKFDAKGNTQIYAARLENGAWTIRQISDWEGYRWEFGGGGSINTEVSLGAIQAAGPGRLSLSYRRKGERGVWELDEETLRVLNPYQPKPDSAESPLSIPPAARVVESPFPGMGKRLRTETVDDGTTKTLYVLAWETLDRNRDRPRSGDLPEPSMLRLFEVTSGENKQ